MGPALTQLRGVQARALLSELERQSRKSIAEAGEIDVPVLSEILETALQNQNEREALVAYLAAYLARCLSGSIPDYRLWDPPAAPGNR